jgi:hypothetical protein
MAFSMSTRVARVVSASPAPRRAPAAVAPRAAVRAHYKITIRGPEGKDQSFE